MFNRKDVTLWIKICRCGTVVSFRNIFKKPKKYIHKGVRSECVEEGKVRHDMADRLSENKMPNWQLLSPFRSTNLQFFFYHIMTWQFHSHKILNNT